MKYATVCSGVEACSVAWEPLGWQPVFFSEIEDFPSEVLNTHYPSVPNHGDMTNFEDWGYERGAVDVICGGTPCQSFSVAGLRRGLSDDRGNLALTFCRMVEQLRPKYFIWENVPGCLSSNGGRDFGSITGAMAQFGYVFGWRVLDAQYFGVPQRRRRVFLVGCASGHPEHIRQILFEPESGRGNSEKSGEAEQGSAKEITGCTDRCSKSINTLDTQCGLEKLTHQSLNSGHYIVEAFDFQRIGQYGTKGVGSTCMARDYKDSKDLVVYECHHNDPRVKEPDQTVTSRRGTSGNNVPLVSFSSNMSERDVLENIAPTVKVGGCSNPPAIVLPINTMAVQGRPSDDLKPRMGLGIGKEGDPCPTLSRGHSHAVFHKHVVRRLTPIEVERLQGFPDDYTNIPWRGKTAPDSPRYKAMGNSMAVPVMRWLGNKIQILENKLALEI